MEPIIDTQEFLALSSFLNYQLSGEPVNWHGILNLMTGKEYARQDEEILLAALSCLGAAYGDQKRRLGPFAILHPIRAAALLAKAQRRVDPLDLLSTLFHDKNEDLTAAGIEADRWREMERKYTGLLDLIGPQQAVQLEERLGALTKPEGQKYYVYLGRLLQRSAANPELVTIKLADRLDNTLDLRIDLHDFTDNSRCYQVLFDVLFINTYKGFISDRPHPISRKINGAMRLYQLYKNAVFLSLVRHQGVELKADARRLFSSLAVASIREAQTILLHIFAYHLRSAAEQKELLMDVMRYSEEGGFNQINTTGGHLLDGLFIRHFVFDGKEMKKDKLQALYDNKPLMGQSALGFIIIFANFINDERYLIRGISPLGIESQD
ncbi:MAG: hypothetical protein AB1568_00835 [Thermodesulfobacteriota bacterium]